MPIFFIFILCNEFFTFAPIKKDTKRIVIL
jgi:hypothetical protein